MRQISPLFFGGVLITLLGSCHKDEPSPVIYQTSFNSGDQWPSFLAGPVLHFVSDHYEIRVLDEDNAVWAYVPCGFLEINYSIAVDVSVKPDDNQKYGSVGILFNHLDNNNYEAFVISSYGHYKILKKTLGNFVTIKDWTVENAIVVGPTAVNRLEIDQLENSAEFKINNVSVGTFQLVRATDFKVALVVITSISPDFTPTTGSFDNLTVRKYPN